MSQQIGYIRVSTVSQNTERQLANIKLDRTFEEKVSASTINRPQWIECKNYVRQGDVLHIHSLDRVCRSGANDAVNIVEELTAKGASVVFHKEGMRFDSSMSAVQKGLLGILASVAQMERDLIKERQAEGIAAAKAKGKRLGRPKTTVTIEQVLELKEKGLGATEISKQLEIGRATVYKILKSA
jgi:DNA invertase Pin-like site-specific DNA recombinase